MRLLEGLRAGERSVGELQERLGVNGPNVSQHLAIPCAIKGDGQRPPRGHERPLLRGRSPHDPCSTTPARFSSTQIASGTALLEGS